MDLRVVCDLALDVIFPPCCVGCHKMGDWCCSSCLDRIERIVSDPCPRCGSLRKHDCDAPRSPLCSVIACGFYHDKTLRGLIHGLKYESATCVLPSIGALLRRVRVDRRDPWPWAGEQTLAVQSVVCSPHRVHARGFDQTELIRDLAIREITPWAHSTSLLVRRQSKDPQADLPVGSLRAANVRGAFAVLPHQPIPESVLLVDDVFTTGSTMRESARVLADAGVKRIYGFALAVGA